MKKTLIAVAALAATAGAFAQSSVTLYGRADVGYIMGETTTETATATTKLNNDGVSSHNSVSSFWGIRGSEDLGGGMRAGFQFEQDLFPATGTLGASGAANGSTSAASFNRRSTVSLSGGFGTIALGRDYNPLFNVTAASDVFNFTRLSTVSSAPLGSTIDRQVMYTTPALIKGLTATVSAGMNDMQTSSNSAALNSRNMIAAVNYNAGKLYVGLSTGNNESQVISTGVTTKNEATAVTVTYDFGVAKLFVGHVAGRTMVNDVAGVRSTSETNVGVNVPFGKLAVQAAYGRNANDSDLASGSISREARSGNDWGVGVTYSLSNRTALFAKTGQAGTLDGTLNGVMNNVKYTETSLGLRHVF